MMPIAIIMIGYVFVLRWLVLKLEANREKLLPNLPEWLRCVLLIVICALPFAGKVLCFSTGLMFDLVLLIPIIGLLTALVNAMIEETTVFLMMQALIGVFSWWANWLSTKLYILLISDDPMTKPVSELFLCIELTILVISTVILAIRKHRRQ